MEQKQTTFFQDEGYNFPARELLVAPGTKAPLYLRLIDLFVVAAVSIVVSGAMLHLRPIWDDKNPLGRFLRTFGAGNVFCLGAVHIAPYSYNDFYRLMRRVGFYQDFEFGGIAVTFGFCVMFLLMGMSQGLGTEVDHNVTPEGSEEGKIVMHITEGLQPNDKNEEGSEETGSDLRRSSVLQFLTEQMAMIFFEFGVVVHSILVGLRLGTKRYNGVETSRTYAIAIVFHQILESAALGIYISSKQIGFVKGWCLATFAQLMFPVGVAIGIGVMDTFDPESISVLTSRAILNGIATGILIYMSTMIIASKEVRMESLLLLPKRWHRAMVYGGFVCGAFTMSLISIWA